MRDRTTDRQVRAVLRFARGRGVGAASAHDAATFAAGTSARLHELRVGRRCVVSFAGELDLATVAPFERAIGSAIDRGDAEIWADLSDTTFLDSAGVHCLLDAERRLSALNRRFAVVCAGGIVARVLRLTGADGILATFPDRAAAHRSR
jgi:anti-sigma B factor antagonist